MYVLFTKLYDIQELSFSCSCLFIKNFNLSECHNIKYNILEKITLYAAAAPVLLEGMGQVLTQKVSQLFWLCHICIC